MDPPFSESTASFIHISLLISTPLDVKLEIARAKKEIVNDDVFVHKIVMLFI